MLHRCLFQLAKKKGPPPRRHVLRRNLRRSSSSASVGTSAARRSGSAASKRTSKDHTSSAAPTKGKGGVTKNGSGENLASNAIEASSGTAAGTINTPVPLVTDEAGHLPPNSARRPLYRLATAVATVVVPPTTNVYLQSMKHLLTPASSPAMASASIGEAVGAATPAVAIVEEYYTSKKGPLFATAVVAGTNAVKQVSSLIPFCYPTPIQRCSFTFRRRQVLQPPRPSQMPHRVVLRRRTTSPGQTPNRPEYSVLYCFCTVATESKSGVEMEALTGATMASVTLYDMLKGLPGAQEDGLSLGEAFVLAKRGGRNDFTKLLMSEPDRPLVESGIRNGGELTATQPPRTSADTIDHASGATDGRSDGGAQQQQQQQQHRSATARGNEELDGSGEDPTPSRVIRRPAPAGGADEEADEQGSPGDSGAWWRTSKHEKRLQELFPRRKYGDGSRLVPTSPTGPDTTANADSKDPGANQSGDVAEEVVPAPKLKHVSKASLIREGRPVTSTSSAKAAAKTTRPSVAHSADAKEDETGSEEPKAENRRSTKGGQLAKKSARGAVPAAADVDDAPDENAVPDEDETAAEDGDGEEEEATQDEDEVEVSKGGKRGRRHTTSSAPAHKSVKGTGKKASASSAAAQRRQSAAHDADEGEAEEDEHGTDEAGDEEEDEEEIVAPTRKSSHSSSSAAAKRHGKTGTAGAAAPPQRSQAANSSRKQRAAASASAAHKKGRHSDEAAEDEDESEAAAESTEEEDTAGAVEEDEEEDEVPEVKAQRGKSAKHGGAAVAPSKKKASGMRPVQHSSWDEGTRKIRQDDDREDDAEADEEDAGANDDDDGAEEDEAPMPPPPPRKKMKKNVKRPAAKRR